MVQVGDIEQMTWICLKYNKITLNWWFSTKFSDDALKWILNSRNMNKNSNFKIVKIMISTSKTVLNHLSDIQDSY